MDVPLIGFLLYKSLFFHDYIWDPKTDPSITGNILKPDILEVNFWMLKSKMANKKSVFWMVFSIDCLMLMDINFFQKSSFRMAFDNILFLTIINPGMSIFWIPTAFVFCCLYVIFLSHQNEPVWIFFFSTLGWRVQEPHHWSRQGVQEGEPDPGSKQGYWRI